MKQVNSQTTMSAKAQPTWSGAALGLLGAGIGQPTAEAIAEAGQKLAGLMMEQTMEKLQSQMLSHNVRPDVDKNWKTGRVQKLSIQPIEKKTKEENLKLLTELRSKLEFYFAPMPDDLAEKKLAQLDAISKKRNRGFGEAIIALDAYTTRLRAYPADIVAYVLDAYNFEWFPSWGEMQEVLDAQTSFRVFLRIELDRAIQRLNSAGFEIEHKKGKDSLSFEKRAEIIAEVLCKHTTKEVS